MEKNLSPRSAKYSRPPVVAVLGHIDHGKSSLLDHIRQTNVVGDEAGGITQHISSYEVTHQAESGERVITFLDTPGHAAFSSVRSQGIRAADIAVLIVSAEDGVKPQTIEAFKSIQEQSLPFVVAVNKIDKPNSDPERTKISLAENGIYIEEYGGDAPMAAISAKTGEGVSELLDTIILLADMQELTADPSEPATGIVIESEIDPKKGIRATLIIKNGTLTKGMAVTSGTAVCPVRMMYNFRGQALSEASFSSPVDLVGWNKQPQVGSDFLTFSNKKEAEKHCREQETKHSTSAVKPSAPQEETIPVIVKSDTVGCLEAIKKEIGKMVEQEKPVHLVAADTGPITENDIRNATVTEKTAVLGFNVPIDPAADRLREQHQIPVKTFSLIYELTDWLAEYVEKHRARHEVEQVIGNLSVLKTFSRSKNRNIIGGRVDSGRIEVGKQVKIIRGNTELGTGTIKELQCQKVPAQSVSEENECGLMVQSSVEIAPGDTIQSYTITIE